MSDITPLYIRLSVMRKTWLGVDLDGGVALANVAAPYPRLQALAARPIFDLSGVSDEELVRTEHDVRTRDTREGAREP